MGVRAGGVDRRGLVVLAVCWAPALLASAPLAAIGAARVDRGAGPVRICEAYASPPQQTGVVPAPLHELSGITASRRHPGIFWAHNDSGNQFEILAMREDGSIVARLPLRGAVPRDIEDVASGPCARDSDRQCLFLSDTGDNWQRREQSRIYRFAEPEPVEGGAPVDVESLAFRYPDGAHNVETLLISPRTGEVFVVTKRPDSLGEIYRLDGLRVGALGMAVPIGELPRTAQRDSLVTGGGVHPAGDRVVLRTYRRIFELRAPGAAGLEEVLLSAPREVPHASQPQGEAITYLADGAGYLFVGEGAGTPIFRTGCAS